MSVGAHLHTEGEPGAAMPTSAERVHPGRRPLGWWGVVFLIGTEGTLFGLLLFANFYLRSLATEWPPPGIEDPELLLSGIRTAFLLGSTIPVVLAERACRRRDQPAMRRWLWTAFAMAALFMAGHVHEYTVLWPEFTYSTDVYGSVFYTITFLHAVHLAVGMAVLVFLVVHSRRGRFDGRSDPPSVASGLLYWHFVDAVWVAVYASLYLSVTWA